MTEVVIYRLINELVIYELINEFALTEEPAVPIGPRRGQGLLAEWRPTGFQ